MHPTSAEERISDASAVGSIGRRSRILMVINSLGGGGAERSLAELLPYCRSAGIEPVVACLRRRPEGVEDELRAQAFDLRHFPVGGALRWVPRLRQLLRTESFDLVHTTIFESDLAGRLAAWGMRLPVLTSLVNTSYEPVRLSDPNVNRIGLWGSRMIDGWTARHLTTHFHAITYAVKDAAVRALGIDPSQVTVVERGRDPERLGVPSAIRRKNARKAMNLTDDEEVIVTVGRQEYQKGQKYLLTALSRISRRRPRVRLLVIGREGNATLELKALRNDLGLEDQVEFLGHIDNVPEVLAGGDLFVFPSLYEGQGGALVEAMALGLPVVATDIPSTREVVEEGRNAILVPSEAPDSLGAAVESLLGQPLLLHAFGARSREIFHERFTLENSARRMIDLYRRVISS